MLPLWDIGRPHTQLELGGLSEIVKCHRHHWVRHGGMIVQDWGQVGSPPCCSTSQSRLKRCVSTFRPKAEAMRLVSFHTEEGPAAAVQVGDELIPVSTLNAPCTPVGGLLG